MICIYKKGITIISLIIIIIITIIIIATTTFIIFTHNNIFNVAIESKYKEELDDLRMNLEFYITSCIIKDTSYNYTLLEWDGENAPINTGKIQDGISEDSIQYILNNSNSTVLNDIIIKNGHIFLNNDVSNEKMQWAHQIGIEPYSNIKIEAVDLRIAKNQQKEYSNLEVSINNDGQITFNTKNGPLAKNTFVKISDLLELNNTSTGLSTSDDLIPINTDISLHLKHIDGTYSANTSKQFNIVLRQEDANGENKESIFKIYVLNGDTMYPPANSEVPYKTVEKNN